MSKRIFYAFLVLFLAACGTIPVITPLPTLAATVATIPTNTVLPASTLTPVPIEATPSPLPPTPTFPSVFTPDAAQVEHWQEYQMELAKYVLSNGGSVFPDYEITACEWDILGRSNQDIYVWAVCSVPGAIGESPAVIYLEPNGSVREIKVVWPSFSWDADIQQLFPIDIQEKIHQYASVSPFSGRPFEMRQRLEYRMTHFGEPPLVVLSAIPLPTQTPPPPTLPSMITPDAAQVEHWKEYQTELAKALFVYNPSFQAWGYGPDAYTDALCEWDILMRSDQEVYVWATCAPASNSPLEGNSRVIRANPAVIHLKPNGSIQEVNVAKESIDPRSHFLVYDLILFPINIQETLCLYYFVNVLQCYQMTPAVHQLDYFQSRQSVLVPHLEYRETHPGEPPLIVLSATPMP